MSILTRLKAFEIAVVIETASKDASIMRHQQVSCVNKLFQKQKPFHRKEEPNPSTWFRCNNKGHAPAECYFIDTVCRGWGIKGHIQRACNSKIKKKSQKQKKHVRHINQTGDSHTDSTDFEKGIEQLTLCTVKKNADAPNLLQVKVNGKEIKMELDTVSALSVISQKNSTKSLKIDPESRVNKTPKLLRGEIEISGCYGRHSWTQRTKCTLSTVRTL